jgi:hypothetical protein
MADEPAKKSDPSPQSPRERAEANLLDQVKAHRQVFLQNFFKRGAEFAEDLVRENERLRHTASELERQNAELRNQLASTEVVRDFMRKIDQLERDRAQLVQSVQFAEEKTTSTRTRFSEIEQELGNLAHLYVASFQLNSTLIFSSVLRHLQELLQQLIGSSKHAIYISNTAQTELVAVAQDGMAKPPNVVVGDANLDKVIDRRVSQAFLTGEIFAQRGDLGEVAKGDLVACVPMRIDGSVLGVIAIGSIFPQKRQLLPVDFELFELLAAHAAAALVGSHLFLRTGGKLPGADAFQKVPS